MLDYRLNASLWNECRWLVLTEYESEESAGAAEDDRMPLHLDLHEHDAEATTGSA